MNASLAIRLTRVDSIAPDFDRAIDLCLFHQYEEAEQLLTQIIIYPDYSLFCSLIWSALAVIWDSELL
jgi:hypothetical protein